MSVAVEVGGWEHECWGEAIERNALVDFACRRRTNDAGDVRLIESRHDLEPDVRISGRVLDIYFVRERGPADAVLRVPSGHALRGLDPSDDGHLEDPWTAEPVTAGSDFIVMLDRP